MAGLAPRRRSVDRVGLQSHLFLGEPDFELAQQTMERITALGALVDITELDIPLLDLSKTKEITLAQQAERGLYDENLRPKPLDRSVLKALERGRPS